MYNEKNVFFIIFIIELVVNKIILSQNFPFKLYSFKLCLIVLDETLNLILFIY